MATKTSPVEKEIPKPKTKPKRKTTPKPKTTDTSKSSVKAPRKPRKPKGGTYTVTKAKRAMANKLRRSMSPPEGKVWKHLKRKFAGVEWYSQAIILGWVADFFCVQKRIVVEVDSSFHIGREAYDAKRDKVMGEHGITILRVQASEINMNVGATLIRILRLVEALPDNPWIDKYY